MNELTKELLGALKACVDYGSMTGSKWVKEKAVAVISKAEAEMAEPQPDADGWIPWAGGECPVPGNTVVEVRCQNLVICKEKASEHWWDHLADSGYNIIAYRIVKEAQ